MKWFANMKITAKLLTGFFFVAILGAAVGVIGIINYKSADTSYNALFDDYGSSQGQLGSANTQFEDLGIDARDMLFEKDVSKRSPLKDEINTEINTLQSFLKQFAASMTTNEEKDIYNNIMSNVSQYIQSLNKMLGFAVSGQDDQALNTLENEMNPLSATINKYFDSEVKYNEDMGNKISDDLTKTTNNTIVLMIVIVAASLVIAVVLGVAISRSISKPLKKLVGAAEILAKGDVNVNPGIKTKDEIGALAHSFDSLIASTREQADIAQRLSEGDVTVDVKLRSENDLLLKAFQTLIASTKEQANIALRLSEGDLTAEMKARSENDLLGKSIAELLDKLNQIVETLVLSSEQVASGSVMVSNSSMALSQGAAEQASSIEQLTASLEEVSSQNVHNAENARTANDLAKKAEINAADGDTQMKSMLAAMTEINESSSSINKIIKVIDDIAFQTNILALNAAVEAARAGQYGKGFAVVAEEVRNLAARSASAAKETTEMIENSIKKVEAGTRIANNTAVSLNQIVEQVKRASDLVSEIAIASTEQAAALEQINQGIIQISQVVQTNAATSQESAAASEELSGQAAQLKEIISIFKLRKKINASLNTSVPKVTVINPVSQIQKAKINLGNDFGKY